jgi:nitrite reductase/ring-hydroxylating ferredoxin subunit
MNAISPTQETAASRPNWGSFHRSWFPVILGREVGSDEVIGVDFLGTRVAVYRDVAGKPVVQNAWCPHLGADLSIGQIVDGQIRCAYHHWRFDNAGQCVNIPAGDKIPPGARIFTYPTAEAWGLVWAFNGERPLFDVPRIPGTVEHELAFETNLRGIRPVPHWVPTSNGVDFQHLRTLHNLPTGAPETVDVRDYTIEYRVETSSYMQHGLITGTNTFAQHLRRGGIDSFMLFAGTPIDQQRTRSFFAVGVPSAGDGAPYRQVVAAKLLAARGFVEKLLAEDEPVLKTMRFKQGVMVGSDRHLSRYFKYVDEFPKYQPPSV